MSIHNSTKAMSGASVVSLASFGKAKAATITFDFAKPSPTDTPGTYSAGGIDMTVTASGTASGDTIAPFDNDANLYATTDTRALKVGTQSLRFDFSSPVNLIDTLVFDAGRGIDTVRVQNLDNGSSMIFNVAHTGAGHGQSGQHAFTFDFADIDPSFQRTGSSFLFQTINSTGASSGVAVTSLNVATASHRASLPLFATDIGVSASRSRR